MDLGGCIRAVIARRLVVFASLAGCLFGGMLVAELVTPRYVASSRAVLNVIRPDPISGVKLSKTFSQAFIQTQVELIRDYRVAGDVVDAFGWPSSPQLLAAYRKRPASDRRDFRRWLAQIVINSTGASLVDGTNILEITFVSTSPLTAKRGADAVRDAYITRATLFRRANATRSAQWFDEQAERLARELTAAQERFESFETANGVILEGEGIDVSTATLSSWARNNRVQTTAGDRPLSGGPFQVSTPAAPSGANKALTAAPPPRPFTNSLSSQARMVLAKRGVIGEASLLFGEIEILKELYKANRMNADKLARESSAQGLGVTKLGEPNVPRTPAFPDRLFIGSASLALGLVLGVILALLIELLDRRVRHPLDLEEGGLKLIGAIRLLLPEAQAADATAEHNAAPRPDGSGQFRPG